MTMTDPLNDLMRASVADASLDVDRLLAVSLREGTRIRRRRRLATAGAGLAVAGIAAAATVGILGLPGEGGRAPDVASDPVPSRTAEPTGLQDGDTIDLPGGVVGRFVRCPPGPVEPDTGLVSCLLPVQYEQIGRNTNPGSGEGFALVLSGPAQAVEDFWSGGFDDPRVRRHDGLTYAVQADSPLVTSVNQGQRVTIDLPGWTLGPLADDKQELTGPDGAVATLVWRPASDHDAWTSDPDKTEGAFVSDVHDGVFVSIQGGLNTTRADLDALGASLTWQ